MRICSTMPGATEVLFALGLGDEVAGVSFECDYPEAAKRKPLLVTSVVDYRHARSDRIDTMVLDFLRRGQSLFQVDLEVLREAQPDVIITQNLCTICAVTVGEVRQAVQELAKQPRLVELHPHSLEDVLTGILEVGKATNRESAALQLVGELRMRIDTVRSKAARAARCPRVLCLEWLKPLMVAGHWVPEMVAAAGGEAGLTTTGQPARYVTWEEVRAYRPEVVVLMPCGFSIGRTEQELELVTALEGWAALPAVADRRVFLVDGNAYYNRSGPRLVDGLEILGQLLHPELTPWPPLPDGAVQPLAA